ncbi:FG-GAP-like repeat-containing protein [Streptomyces sp. NPDC058914]|uniref:FG-GAP-like repeat-containing protein n=1 Tax=Streptomyces TaxID=1883 RepID=UPI00368B7EB8
MPRHVRARLRLVAASALLATGLTPLLPSSAAADTPQETVVPATLRSTYTGGALYRGLTAHGQGPAGHQGAFHTLEGSGLVWTRYSDGTSTKVVKPTGYVDVEVTDGDSLAYYYSGDDGRQWVELRNAADGTTRTIQPPMDTWIITAYDDLAVAKAWIPDDTGEKWETHLLFPNDDGTTRDVPVTGVPEGTEMGDPLGGNADSLFFEARRDGQFLAVQVDRRTGEVTGWTPPLPITYYSAKVTHDHLVLYYSGAPVLLVYDTADLSAGPTEVPPGGADGAGPGQNFGVVGDWIVHQPGYNGAVVATPLTGGPTVTLLISSFSGVANASDGTAVVVGRTSAATDDWGVQRIQPGPDGTPVVTRVKALPRPRLKIQGLSLDHGLLVLTDQEAAVAGGGARNVRLRTVAPTGTPVFGPSSDFLRGGAVVNCAVDDVACSAIWGAADGQLVWLNHDAATGNDWLRSEGPSSTSMRSVPAGGRITDVSSRYVIHTTATQQSVHHIAGTSAPILTRTPGAAALSGHILWTPGTAPGAVTAYDLAARKTTETLTTDAGCTPTDLQALGRWLYWTCDGRAGVYDRTAHRSVPVPADEAALGDGYVVTHDKQAGKLVLTTVADGTPASRVIGDLPDTGVSQRNVRWTVDESGANAAYVDAEEQVHLVPSGVAQQPLRLLETPRVATTIRYGMGDVLTSLLLLSKPAAGWDLVVYARATGARVGGTDGGAVRGALDLRWDGRNAHGLALPNGQYDWTLTVEPADGVGAPLEMRGTVQMLNGKPVFHDQIGPGGKPDGVGDLMSLTSSGALSVHQGTGQGTFSGGVKGTGWPAGITPVPLGDLSGDRCNDLLVRLSSGAVRLYKPGCGKAPTPSTPYTTLATSGWNTFDIVTSPGDVTGDGRPDVIARKAATGVVYLYKGTSAGTLTPAVKLYADWRKYKKVVGAGDLNGDGVGDLLTQDKANNLFRFFGRSNGTFAPGVKLYANWGAPYNALVGVGDTTGDGKADLVARDTAGVLYRIPGNGKGSFSPRVKIATGWQVYKGIF